VANAARPPAVPWLRRQWAATAGSTRWLPVWSRAAALRAVRATIVVPGLFALCDQVIGNLQMATFAAFGGFATLVLASFAGTWREKLLAHATLAVAGSVLLTIGTAVNSSTVLAAIVTVPVTFVVFFAGVAGPNAASGVNAALLAYILPAASPGTISMVPDRLAGWWLASAVGTASVLLLSAPSGADRLRASVATLATRLADELDAALRGTATDELLAGVLAAKDELMATFTASPYRPTGLAAPDDALANAVELLEWCTALIADAVRERADLRDARPVDRELLEAASEMLREVSGVFSGGRQPPDLDRLERRREQSVSSFGQLAPDGAGFRAAAQVSFHANAIAVAALAVAADALIATRLADEESIAAERRRWYLGSANGPRTPQRVSSVATIARSHASLRSVWFVNSLRGSLALAAAVAVADLTGVQHGFWVVLGTLSVLRTNAASTGSTALRALLGTAVGFVIGGALLVAIGSTSTALWVVLPIAVFVAAYAPGTAPFAVGQAAFTVTVAVLFNLLVPVGWKVGIVRIEDVALGCAISVAVGTLFWPRGVTSVVGDDLADAFRAGAAYLTQAIGWATGSRAVEPDAAATAVTAGVRLDDALRGLLAEQGTKRIAKQQLWRLVGGTMRLRLTARAVTELPHDATGIPAARQILDRRARALETWYEQLAESLERPHRRAAMLADPPTFGPQDVVDNSSGSLYGIWLCEHLDHLGEHLSELVPPATRVAEIRRQQWWR
jgi:uncharacterized membrane protein YccC